MALRTTPFETAILRGMRTEGLEAWTCQRQSAGVPCRHLNPNRKRNCEACGKTRPPRKRPAHLAALETDYADFIALNGGEFCAICKRPPSQARRLDRDHCHKTGEATGLFCARCNRSAAVLGRRRLAAPSRRLSRPHGLTSSMTYSFGAPRKRGFRRSGVRPSTLESTPEVRYLRTFR
jgi:hypothetical protein